MEDTATLGILLIIGLLGLLFTAGLIVVLFEILEELFR